MKVLVGLLVLAIVVSALTVQDIVRTQGNHRPVRAAVPGPMQRTRAFNYTTYCPTFQCGSTGAVCGLNITSRVQGQCNLGSQCNASNIYYGTGTCVANLATGASCGSNAQNGFCAPTAECFSNGNGGDTCQTITFNVALGSPCNDVSQCSGNNVCADNLCVVLPTQGSSCAQYNACSGNAVCSTGLECIAAFSLAAGGACTDSTYCQPGYFCGNYSNEGVGVCIEGFSSSLAPCNIDADCPSIYETCECSIVAGSVPQCFAPPLYTSQQAIDISNFFTCIEQNNCNIDEASTISACSACKKQFCSYFNGYIAIPDTAWTIPSINCFIDEAILNLGKSQCSIASVVSASLVLLLCIVFVLNL